MKLGTTNEVIGNHLMTPRPGPHNGGHASLALAFDDEDERITPARVRRAAGVPQIVGRRAEGLGAGQL